MSTETAASAGDARRLDADGDDPSAYKDFVLYMLHDNPGCDKLLNMVRAKPGLADNTWVQDVKLLTERPAWLNGVPIIVHKAEKKAYRGTSAFTFVAAHVDDNISFGGFGTSSNFAFADGKDAGNPRTSTRLGGDTYGLVNNFAADPQDKDQAAAAGGSGTSEDLQPPSADVNERKKRKAGMQEDANSATEAFMDARRAIDARVQQTAGVAPRAAAPF